MLDNFAVYFDNLILKKVKINIFAVIKFGKNMDSINITKINTLK